MSDALARLDPAVIMSTTAFAAGGNPGKPTPLDGPDVPVLQVIIASTKRAAWCDSPRGLGAADLAMHVVLPELDGRMLAGAVSFKHPLPPHAGLAFTALINQPEPDRIAMVAERAAALVRLRTTPPDARRIAILMPDYPGAPGRTGYAVGLDVPASVVALLADLAAAGYTVGDAPTDRAGVARCAERARSPRRRCRLTDYARLLAQLPAEIAARINARLGRSRGRPRCARWRVPLPRAQLRQHHGGAAARSRAAGDRRADYHDPALPPRHALVAFGLWLQHARRGRRHRAYGGAWHARMAARQGGGVERVLLSASRVGRAAGLLSVHRQQSGRGRASQAQDRGRHHRPSAAAAGRRRAVGRGPRLERLVDEYAQADGLDPRRRAAPGDADRRNRAAQRPCRRSRHRPRHRPRRSARASMPGSAI